MQQIIFSLDPNSPPLSLPAEAEILMDGVVWGSAAEPFTPAFWRALLHQGCASAPNLRLGSCLREEVAACLLGGYGIPAEVGLAAYKRLKSADLLSGGIRETEILAALMDPLSLSNGRSVRYRFAQSKAAALAVTLELLDGASVPVEARRLREWLTRLPGVGLKTASWIVRNHLDSDAVAILDVHLLRAGYLMGLFPHDIRLPRDYLALESSYLEFASRMGVRAALLDACIWAQMKKAGRMALEAVQIRREASTGTAHQVRLASATNSSAKPRALQ